MAAAAGVEKQLDKIQKYLDSGSFYEAQQMFKTTYYRYKSKRLIPESYEVLKTGALKQLSHKQTTCGAELALLLLDAFKADTVTASTSNVKDLESIIESFPSTSGSGDDPESSACLEEFERVVSAAVTWAQQQGGVDQSQDLHDAAAKHLWKAYGWKQLGRASLHFCRGRDALAFADALADVAKLITPAEADYVVARAVLQTLAAAKPATKAAAEDHAHRVYSACKERGVLSDSPATNFVKFLLAALDHESHKLFDLVRSKYEPCWSKDPSFEAYLLKIERAFFPSQNPGGPLGGLLGNIMSMLQEDE